MSKPEWGFTVDAQSSADLDLPERWWPPIWVRRGPLRPILWAYREIAWLWGLRPPGPIIRAIRREARRRAKSQRTRA